VLNISEVKQSINVGHVHKISHEDDIVAHIDNAAYDNNIDIDRVSKIKTLIRTGRLILMNENL